MSHFAIKLSIHSLVIMCLFLTTFKFIALHLLIAYSLGYRNIISEIHLKPIFLFPLPPSPPSPSLFTTDFPSPYLPSHHPFASLSHYVPTSLPPHLPTSLSPYLSTSLPPYLPTFLPPYPNHGLLADNITVFAPTDAAFARVPSDQLAALASNPTELQKILGYHALLQDVKALHRNGLNRLSDKVITSSNNLPIRINVYKLVHVCAF